MDWFRRAQELIAERDALIARVEKLENAKWIWKQGDGSPVTTCKNAKWIWKQGEKQLIWDTLQNGYNSYRGSRGNISEENKKKNEFLRLRRIINMKIEETTNRHNKKGNHL